MTEDNLVNISGGNVQGVIQENNGIVNQNFITQYAESYSGQVSGTEQSLTQVEYRQRKVLLSKVKEYWIKGVLERSLHIKAMIELGLEERLDAVERPFSGFEELPEGSRQILPTGTGATEVFNKIGEGRTLLILGEPGSGKTITLLKLAQNLIASAEENVSCLIPVVFNLSSWGSKHQTIADWLVQELWSKYGVPKEFGKDWVKNQQLLLLLDGLDEVKADRREACVEAINQFMQEHGQTEMVVCSRIADYEVLSRLQLRGAIKILSLTPEQVNQYLDTAGEQLEAVKTLLNEDTDLQKLAKSPLMLSIMTLAYQGKKVEELPQTGSIEERSEHLFDEYIKRMFSHERIGKPKEYKSPYQNQQTKSWLTWLAQPMKQESESIFLIEKMQTTWLSPTEKRYYLIGYTLTVWIFIGIAWCLFEKHDIDIFKSIVLILTPLCFRIFAAYFRVGLFGPFPWSNGEILTYESIILSWTKIRELIIRILIPGFPFIKRYVKPITIIYILIIFASLFNRDKNYIVLAISSPLSYSYVVNIFRIFDLPGIVDSVLKGEEIKKKMKPNQGIWITGKNAIILGGINIIFFGSIGAIFYIAIKFCDLLLGSHTLLDTKNFLLGIFVFVLPFGVIGSLRGGLLDCIRHIQLRLFLTIRHHAPWNYARFLDYATERLFLQKVGGGYIFVHRMLLEHFARME